MSSSRLHPPRTGRPPAGSAPLSHRPRLIEPELLDGLDPASPAARASRRDLHRLNGLMGNHGWFGRQLRRHLGTGETVLELGAGTGELGRSLHPVAPDLAGLDLVPRPAGWPVNAPWFETDVLTFTGWAGFPVVIGNLFFHHFNDAQLARLGDRMNAARVIIASEPLRHNRTDRLFSLLCPLLRAHPVTRHDGRVSIAAGFQDDELPRLLRLDPTLWSWHVSATWRGASRLVAVKRA